jgi:hypothetical protein
VIEWEANFALFQHKCFSLFHDSFALVEGPVEAALPVHVLSVLSFDHLVHRARRVARRVPSHQLQRVDKTEILF